MGEWRVESGWQKGKRGEGKKGTRVGEGGNGKR
jgi:hypothetical protein